MLLAEDGQLFGTSAAVLLQDEFRYGTTRNYYDAVIDGATVVKIAPAKALKDAFNKKSK